MSIRLVDRRTNYIPVSEGVPCETPDGEYGLCININDCKLILNLLITQSNNPEVRNFLKSSRCNSVKPVRVCCPQPKPKYVGLTTNSPNTNNKPTPNTGNALSKLPKSPKCGFSNVTNPRIVNGIPAKLGKFCYYLRDIKKKKKVGISNLCNLFLENHYFYKNNNEIKIDKHGFPLVQRLFITNYRVRYDLEFYYYKREYYLKIYRCELN